MTEIRIRDYLPSDADDLNRIAVAGVDQAHAQTVGVRVLLGLDDLRDHESAELPGLVLDVLDLEPHHGELVGERIERLVGGEVFFEP